LASSQNLEHFFFVFNFLFKLDFGPKFFDKPNEVIDSCLKKGFAKKRLNPAALEKFILPSKINFPDSNI